MINKEYAYSFDVFDTLVYRNCGSHLDFFHYLSQEIFDDEMFYKKRVQAEVRARKKIDEPTLAQIYEYLPTYNPELEFNADLNMLMLRKEIVDNLEKKRAAGNKIILITDTYYTKPQMERILKKFEIYYDDLFVSSEHSMSKKNGKLFVKVQNRYQIIEHMGDNYVSDFVVPKENGINCIHIASLNLTAVENWLSKNKKFELLQELRRIRSIDSEYSTNLFQLRFLLSHTINHEIKLAYPNATVVYLSRDGFWPFVFSRDFSLSAYYFQTSRRAVRYRSTASEKGLKNYIEQLDLPSSPNIVLFDIGWTGKHPVEVAELLSDHGYASTYNVILLGAHTKIGPNVSTLLFDTTSKTKLSGFSNLFELILTAPHMSLVSYEHINVLQKNNDCANGARSKMSQIVSSSISPKQSLLNLDEITELFLSLFNHPTVDFVVEVDNLQHTDDLSGKKSRILGKNILEIIIGQRRQKIWTEGTILKLFPKIGRWIVR